MELDKKLKIIKDIKTARRLTRQAKTMLNNSASSITEEKPDSRCATELIRIADSFNIEGEKFDKSIEEFKREQNVAGYQMTIFDSIV